MLNREGAEAGHHQAFFFNFAVAHGRYASPGR
jgi:hypothetical protein